jgi:hypothetical protein
LDDRDIEKYHCSRETWAISIRQVYMSREAAGAGGYTFNLFIFIIKEKRWSIAGPLILLTKGDFGPKYFLWSINFY